MGTKNQKPGGPENTPASRWIVWSVYGLAVLLAAIGQMLIMRQEAGQGIGLTLAGVLAALLGMQGRERLSAWMSGARRLGQQTLAQLESLTGFLGPKVSGSGKPSPSAAVFSAPVASARTAVPSEPVVLAFKKKTLLLTGGALLVISQPLLFMEHFLPGLSLLLPGLALAIFALTSQKPQLVLGRQDELLKALLLAIPGLVLIFAGDFFIYKNLEVKLWLESLGVIFHGAGIFLIMGLLPSKFPDPESDSQDVLDRNAGEAQTQTQGIIKIALVAAAAVLFLIARLANLNYDQMVYFSLAGLTALFLSFPWTGKAGAFPWDSGLLRMLRLLAFGLALYLGYHGQLLISKEQIYPGLYSFGGAVLALLFAFREPQPGGPDELKELSLKWHWEAIGLCVILAAAAWLRAYHLDSIPFGIECDEAGAGYHAVDVLKNQFSSLIVHPSGRPLFMLLDKAVAFKFFGIDNIGMRFTAMMWGVIGVFALYLLARYFYGPKIALAAAALLALSRWHIHFSRFGWANTLMVLLQIGGFYFLAKGLSSRRKWHFFIAGAALAWSVHTETAARMVPFIVLGILAYFVFIERHFFQRNWRPVLAVFLGAYLTGAGLFIFWVKKPQYLFNRVYEVSVFSKDMNAPKNLTEGLVTSSKLNLLQMNSHGDTRERHNGGLSGEPMLDFWSAILFTLGFGIALYHWRRFRYFLPLIWFFGFMSASIFSIEAPQSHRGFGVVATLFLFAGGFLDRARRLLRETLGKKGVLGGGLAFALLLIPITSINYHKYFDTIPGFDAHCTATARYMGKVWPKAYHTIMSAYLWMGHPPFILYARDVEGHFDYSASEAVPFRMDIDKDVVFSTIFEYPPILPVFQYFYPKGIYHEESHPKFKLLFKSWAVKHEDILATRGLTTRIWTNPNQQGKPVLVRKDEQLPTVFDDKNWPWQAPGSLSWEGTILIPHWGDYTFFLSGTDPIEMQLGSKVFLQSANNREVQQTLRLSGGLHRLRIRAQHVTPNGQMSLLWSSSTGFPFHFNPLQDAFGKQPIPKTHLFTYPKPAGLLETYYSSANWTGKIRLQKIEPGLCFVWNGYPYGLQPPVSVEWRGWIEIEKNGSYLFDLDSAGYSDIKIDQQLVLQKGGAPAGASPGGVARNPVVLTPGRHAVVIRWSVQNGSLFRAWWTPPGGEREILPTRLLTPAEE